MKKCTNQNPTIRVSMHVPATDWHPHLDKTFSVKKPTEFEAWAHLMKDTLMHLTAGNLRLMVGYWGDALNTLPKEARTALITVIAQGLGLQIRSVPDQKDTVEVKLVPRYDPLVGDKKTESGLVLPGGGTGQSDLILPNDPRYNEKRR